MAIRELSAVSSSVLYYSWLLLNLLMNYSGDSQSEAKFVAQGRKSAAEGKLHLAGAVS